MTSCSQWPQRAQMPCRRVACAQVGSPYPGGGVSVIAREPLRSPAERSAEQAGGEAGVALREPLAAGDEDLLAARDRDAGARARDRGVDQLARHEREILVGQEQGDRVELAALALVDGEGPGELEAIAERLDGE